MQTQALNAEIIIFFYIGGKNLISLMQTNFNIK